MVQAIDNWADLTGVVQGVSEQPGPAADRTLLQLRVTESRSVDAKPNLFRDSVGSTVQVSLPRGAITGELRPGTQVTLRARATGPDQAFASSQGVRTID